MERPVSNLWEIRTGLQHPVLESGEKKKNQRRLFFVVQH